MAPPAVFDGSGSVISNSQISNRYTYTGREYDATLRLYHYRARMYDSQLGRFLGRGPIGFEGSEWNPYESLSSNPNQWLDPTGYFSLRPATLTPIDEAELFPCMGSCSVKATSTIPPGASGYVTCDGGDFSPVVNPFNNDGDCFSTCGIDNCFKEHEDMHVEQFRIICPDACREPHCGKALTPILGQVYVVEIPDLFCRDLLAYKAEINCLIRLNNSLLGTGRRCTQESGATPRCTNYALQLARSLANKANLTHGCNLRVP